MCWGLTNLWVQIVGSRGREWEWDWGWELERQQEKESGQRAERNMQTWGKACVDRSVPTTLTLSWVLGCRFAALPATSSSLTEPLSPSPPLNLLWVQWKDSEYGDPVLFDPTGWDLLRDTEVMLYGRKGTWTLEYKRKIRWCQQDQEGWGVSRSYWGLPAAFTRDILEEWRQQRRHGHLPRMSGW